MQTFKINNEITVSPFNNQVSSSIKLEPRLMKLLCLLTENAGTLVTREEIIDKIWNGYGGGDEGLTQAISFLRKALNDKEIIETVPKGGYILKGKIELVPEEMAVAAPLKPARSISYSAAGIAAGILIMLFILVFYLFNTNHSSNFAPKPPTPAPNAQPAEFAPKAQPKPN